MVRETPPDVGQTDSEPLPEVAPARLKGDAPAGLWEALAGPGRGGWVRAQAEQVRAAAGQRLDRPGHQEFRWA